MAGNISKIRRQYQRIARARSELAWVMGGQAVAFLGSLLAVKVLTNVMSQASYGQLALGLALSGLVNMFLFGPVAQVILRFYSVSHEQRTQGVYFSVLKKLHTQLIAFLAFVGLAIPVVINYLVGGAWAFLVAIAFLFSIVAGLISSFQSLLTAARERKLVAISQVTDVWLRFAFAYILVLVVGSTGYWALLGYVLGSVVVLVLQLRIHRRMISTTVDNQVINSETYRGCRLQYYSFAYPFAIYALFGALGQYADRWILQGLHGEEMVGAYAALYQIASAPVIFVATFVMQLVIPVVFSHTGDRSHIQGVNAGTSLLRFSVIILCCAYIPVVVGAALWGETIVALFTNENYGSHGAWLWLLVVGLAFSQVAQMMTVHGLSHQQSRLYIGPKMVQALTLLIAGYLLVANHGLKGMIAGLLLSCFVFFVLVLRANSRLPTA